MPVTLDGIYRPRTGYLPTLDGWRAIAIVLVLCNHSPRWFSHFGIIKTYGHLGVDIFFALSGLLICTRLLEEERVFGYISLRGFYTRRFFRIQPASFVYLAVVAIFALVSVVPIDWPAWWAAVALWRNYFTAFFHDTLRDRMTGHFWSLAVEEHFYLLLPCLLVVVRRHRRALLLGLTILAFVWLTTYLAVVPPALRSIDFARRTDLRIASLLFPAWLAVEIARPSGRARLTRLLRPWLLTAMLVAGVGAFVAHSVWVHHAAPSLPAPSSVTTSVEQHTTAVDADAVLLRGGNSSVFVQFVVPVLFPFLVLATLFNPGTWYGRCLELPPLRWMGRISYSLYLWQQMFWVPPYDGWPIARLQRHPAAALLVTLLCAIASFYLVERPLIRLGHRLLPPPTPGHQDTAASAL